MKKTIVLLSLVVLIAALLMAFSVQVPLPIQTIQGKLQWNNHNGICGFPDYVSLPVMDNYYLTGKGFPTQGQFEGCTIYGQGTLSTIEGCKIFTVTDSKISCSKKLSILPSR